MFSCTSTTLGFLIVITGLSFYGCGDSNADSGELKTSDDGRSVTVRVEVLKPQPFVESLNLAGSIKAFDDIVVSPEEGGVVKEWKYAKGAVVPRGAIIARLNDDVIKPSYDAAAAQYKSAELTLEKQKRVYEEQAVSEWQLETTLFNRDAAKAQADLMKARWERTQIKSPVSGILDERFADVGEMAPPGAPIARIVNIDKVKVVVSVPERYAGTISIGTVMNLSVLAYPDKAFEGTVSYIGSALNADNRTFPIECVIKNPGRLLKPEMIAKVRLIISRQKNALLVTEGIVQQTDREKYVVFVENGGKAIERVVTLGGRNHNLVEVVAGLNAGDRVITSGYQQVVNGQAVVVAANTKEAVVPTN